MRRHSLHQAAGLPSALALAVALALGSVPVMAEEPAGPASADGSGVASTTVRRFALIIGANDGGKGRVVLRYAHSDAESMAKVLRELGGIWPQDHVLLLEPDRYGMLSGLKMIETKLRMARAQQGLRIELIFYFSGHSDEEGLLLSGQRFEYQELKAALKELPADVRIAILDSCASGALTRGKGGKRRPPFLVDASSQVRGHAYLASASVDEQAQESERVGGSFFTHYLVSGLRGAADTSQDRRVTLNEAYHHAFHETLARTQSTLGGPQHPNYDIQLAGSGDLVLTDLRGTAALLVFGEKLQGRAWVRDARRRLVAEIDKRFGQATSLGLEPGLYEVTWEKPAAIRRGEITLAAGKEHSFEPEKLARIEAELAVARGGTRRPAVAVPGAAAPAPPGVTTQPSTQEQPKPRDIREARRLYKEQQREAKKRLREFERAEKKRIRAERRADKEFAKKARAEGISDTEVRAELARRRAAREAELAQRRAAREAEAPDGGSEAAAGPGPATAAPATPTGEAEARTGEGSKPAAQAGASEEELEATPADRLQTGAQRRSLPVAACFVPGVSTFTGARGPHNHRFAFNFIGKADDLDGFELSGLGALRRGDVRGVQFSGLFNYARGEVYGAQLSGAGNIARGPVHGGQVAGLFNWSGDSFGGFQAAGLGNKTTGAASGIQAAGFGNVAAGGFRGFQLAGFGNYNRGATSGVQIGGVGNIVSGEFSGLQLSGLFNYARHASGLQLGVINISDSNDGVGLGLLTYAGDGLLEPTAWSSDTGFVNVGLKIGTRKLYGLFGVGYHDYDTERWSSFIHGIGGHFELDPVYFDIDLVAHWLNDRHDWGSGELDLMAKLRITMGVRLGDSFSFYFGPALGYLISEVRSDAGLFDFSLYKGSFLDGSTRYHQRVWPGVVFGLQVEPQSGRLNSHGDGSN